MNRLLAHAGLLLTLGSVACGGSPLTSARPFSVQQALTQSAEMLEFETPAVRLELFHELGRLSEAQEGRVADGAVVFPMAGDDGQFLAAPAFEASADLLEQVSASASPVPLTFSSRPGEGWSEDRRDSLQGLSEREAAELVAASLVTRWGLSFDGAIQVDRAAGAPYAAAYVDGILRINPAFVYMAASVNPVSP